MNLHSLPLFLAVAGRPVILVGEGEAADAKRRLLERAGAVVVGEDAEARLAIVVDDDAAVGRLTARGVLVNAVDRPELCDFTLPAIVDRSPVIVAIGTGGVSAGLAAALRQRLEALLPAGLGRLAAALHGARAQLREALPDAGERRRAIATVLAPGGSLDPLCPREGGDPDRAPAFAGAQVVRAVTDHAAPAAVEHIVLSSPDPDDLTLRQARWLAAADRILHRPDVPPAILDRARADAARMVVAGAWPQEAGDGRTVRVECAP